MYRVTPSPSPSRKREGSYYLPPPLAGAGLGWGFFNVGAML